MLLLSRKDTHAQEENQSAYRDFIAIQRNSTIQDPILSRVCLLFFLRLVNSHFQGQRLECTYRFHYDVNVNERGSNKDGMYVVRRKGLVKKCCNVYN